MIDGLYRKWYNLHVYKIHKKYNVGRQKKGAVIR